MPLTIFENPLSAQRGVSAVLMRELSTYWGFTTLLMHEVSTLHVLRS